MPLIANELTVWEIGFRMADLDPTRVWPRIPLSVKDYFRTLMQAILHGELECETLEMRKWKQEDGKDMAPFFIRYHLREVEECIKGVSYDRKLMRWSRINRWAFEDWCNGRDISLPEFWFPQGWRHEFNWEKTLAAETTDKASKGREPYGPALIRIVCQHIAKALWKRDPTATIASLVRSTEIQELGGGAHYSPDVVRRWLKDVASAEVKAKRGRPSKKNPPRAPDGT